MKTCRVCKTQFEPRSSLAVACSAECAIAIAAKKRAKVIKASQAHERKVDKEKREKLKSRADWAREAQSAFNSWVRLRDADQPCISCGRHHQGQYQAGHYLSRGARPELAYEPLNCHKQCSACNLHLSGNVVLYRKALIGKIGLAQVEWLEGPHAQKHYSVDDLKEIKAKYTALAKALKAAA